MRLVPIGCVKLGVYLSKTLYDNDGRVLLRQGVKLTEQIINRLKIMGIPAIYINDEYSDNIIEDIIKPELRLKAINTVKKAFNNFEKCVACTNKNYEKAERRFIKEKQRDFQAIAELANDIMNQVIDSKNLLINLVDIKTMDNYTYQHCVNVAVLSVILGVHLGLTKNELYDLCMGAIVHDIGKILVPKEIIQKPGKLTYEEMEEMKQHSLRGYDYLKDSIGVSAATRIVALQHHEKINGRGYPDQRKGDEINKLARIVSITDVYDALTSDRPYRRAMNPSDAIELIMAGGDTDFDYGMVSVFAKVVVPYPEGTIVNLSTGETAVVEDVDLLFPGRPTVRIVKSDDHNNVGRAYDLVQELNIVIKSIQYDVVEENK